MSPRHNRTAPRRVNIGQLDLDLRGLPRAVAESAARNLGPELGRAITAALGQRHPGLSTRSSTGSRAVAAGIAERVAARILGSGED